jgi:hypothetical protein
VRKHGGAEKSRWQDALLKISGNQKRELRFRLQAVQQDDGFIAMIAVKSARTRRRRHGHRSDVVPANAIREPQVLRVPNPREPNAHTNHEELAYLLFAGERA